MCSKQAKHYFAAGSASAMHPWPHHAAASLCDACIEAFLLCTHSIFDLVSRKELPYASAIAPRPSRGNHEVPDSC